MQVLIEMQEANISPGRKTYSQVARHLRAARQEEAANAIAERMQKAGFKLDAQYYQAAVYPTTLVHPRV